MMTTTLPERFCKALKALQAQAEAVNATLPDADGIRRNKTPELIAAQQEMAEYDHECKVIVRAVLKAPSDDYAIPELTEAKLAELLGFAS